MLRFEVLQAQEGDCFVMRWSQGQITRLAVIDGGPKKGGGRPYAYLNLKRRLDALKGHAATLPIDWMMVSHIDDDHINGLLTLTSELRDRHEHGDPPPYDVKRFWFNGFEDLAAVGPAESHGASAAIASLGAPQVAGLGHETQAVLASVNQGRDLRDALATLGLDDNAPVGGLVRSGLPTQSVDGLKVTVVGPLETQLQKLRTDWIHTKPRTAEAAAYADMSVANLSSIVCHVAFQSGDETRTLLLTGDARGDYLLEGLEAANLLDNGKIKLTLLKLPHHGSDRNSTAEFYEKVVADHYVISANGKHDNPDPATLEWLIQARGADPYVLHISNKLPWMEDFFAERAHGRHFEVIYRGLPEDDDSIDEIVLD